MASFRFCETNLLHIKLFVVNNSAISPFLGGQERLVSAEAQKKEFGRMIFEKKSSLGPY